MIFPPQMSSQILFWRMTISNVCWLFLGKKQLKLIYLFDFVPQVSSEHCRIDTNHIFLKSDNNQVGEIVDKINANKDLPGPDRILSKRCSGSRMTILPKAFWLEFRPCFALVWFDIFFNICEQNCALFVPIIFIQSLIGFELWFVKNTTAYHLGPYYSFHVSFYKEPHGYSFHVVPSNLSGSVTRKNRQMSIKVAQK